MTNPGAVLSLLDGPSGYDPGSRIVWSKFRMMRKHQTHEPEETSRIYRMIQAVGDWACVHLVVQTADRIGLLWDAAVPGWSVEPAPDGHSGCCSLFCSVPGFLQTVQRAEL